MSAYRDTVGIFLKDIKLNLAVGVYESEHHAPQPVTLSIKVEAQALPSYDLMQKRTLTDVINYDAIYNFLHDDLPRLGHIDLLETVAEHICSFCLRDPRAHRVEVRLEKSQIYPGPTLAGIELVRYRAASHAGASL